MKPYILIVRVDSDDYPRFVLNEVVSAFEFDHQSIVQFVVVLDDAGKQLASHYREEKTTW